ncbi:MAG: hypothetical protein ACE5H9_11395 [Anaerolineae bacterium]
MLLLKILVIWFAINVVILATSWYATTVIKPRFPEWWKRNIIDDLEA